MFSVFFQKVNKLIGFKYLHFTIPSKLFNKKLDISRQIWIINSSCIHEKKCYSQCYSCYSVLTGESSYSPGSSYEAEARSSNLQLKLDHPIVLDPFLLP